MILSIRRNIILCPGMFIICGSYQSTRHNAEHKVEQVHPITSDKRLLMVYFRRDLVRKDIHVAVYCYIHYCEINAWRALLIIHVILIHLILEHIWISLLCWIMQFSILLTVIVSMKGIISLKVKPTSKLLNNQPSLCPCRMRSVCLRLHGINNTRLVGKYMRLYHDNRHTPRSCVYACVRPCVFSYIANTMAITYFMVITWYDMVSP